MTSIFNSNGTKDERPKWTAGTWIWMVLILAVVTPFIIRLWIWALGA